jgi:hypothetical protein
MRWLAMGDLKIFEWLLGALSGLLGLLYLGLSRRLEVVEAKCDKMPGEFEREELTRQRIRTEGDLRRIFEALDEIKDRNTARHLELLEKIDEKADKP